MRLYHGGEDVKKFWMLFLEGGEAPKYQHPNIQSAQGEAERLKRMYPNKHVFILEAVSIAALGQPPIVHIEIDDLPF